MSMPTAVHVVQCVWSVCAELCYLSADMCDRAAIYGHDEFMLV